MIKLIACKFTDNAATLTMPHLYFVAFRKYDDVHTLIVKFGNCEEINDRLSTYCEGACKYAYTKYNYHISKNKPLDDHINNRVLLKKSLRPLVDFKRSRKSGAMTDWFTMDERAGELIILYINRLKELCNVDNFAKQILSFIAASPSECECIEQRILQEDLTSSRQSSFCKYDTHASARMFMYENYVVGGMTPLKDLKSHCDWLPTYAEFVQVKRIHMCKSCKRKARMECCPQYSSTNRVMVRMVIGWSK